MRHGVVRHAPALVFSGGLAGILREVGDCGGRELVGFPPPLRARGKGNGPARQLPAGFAREHEVIDDDARVHLVGQEIREPIPQFRRVGQICAVVRVLHNLAVVKALGLRKLNGIGEGIVIEATALPRRAGGGVAIRPAEAAEGQAPALGVGVRRAALAIRLGEEQRGGVVEAAENLSLQPRHEAEGVVFAEAHAGISAHAEGPPEENQRVAGRGGGIAIRIGGVRPHALAAVRVGRIVPRHPQQSRMICGNQPPRLRIQVHQRLRRIRGRGLPLRHIRIGVEQLDGKAVVHREFMGELAENLPALLLLNQIVEIEIGVGAVGAGNRAVGRVVHEAADESRALGVTGAGGREQPVRIVPGVGHSIRPRCVEDGKERAGIRNAGVVERIAPGAEGLNRPVPVAGVQLAAAAPARREHQVRRADLGAADQAEIEIAAAVGDVLVGGRKLEALEIRARDEVRHAGDGVGAVGGRRAVFQQLHPLNGHAGNHVDIHEQLPLLADGIGRPGVAPPVGQHQGAARPEAAHIDVRRALQAIRLELIGLAVGPRTHAQGAHQLDEARAALVEELFAVHHLHGQRSILRGVGDVRAGHHNLLDAAGLSLGFLSQSHPPPPGGKHIGGEQGRCGVIQPGKAGALSHLVVSPLGFSLCGPRRQPCGASQPGIQSQPHGLLQLFYAPPARPATKGCRQMGAAPQVGAGAARRG